MGIIAIEKCDTYNTAEVDIAINKLFQNLGGVEKFIKPGMRVALKPNLVMKKKPEEAITTHPEIVRAVASAVKRAGGIPYIAESPGGIHTAKILSDVYSECGMLQMASEIGLELNYDLSQINISNPSAKYLKTVTVIKPLVDADIIINLPKMKTHGMMVFSGAVKNMFGAVPGVLKAEQHFRMAEHDKFADAIIDIMLSVKPALNIMDAIDGMDENGPSAGRIKHMGMLMASEDAIELDYYAMTLISADPVDSPVLKQAMERGLYRAGENHAVVLSSNCSPQEAAAYFKIKDFRMPDLEALRVVEFFNTGWMKVTRNLIKPKPVFISKKCIKCGECVRDCPVHIIKFKNGKPQADLTKCIRCFCCQELCPVKAVKIHRSMLVRFAMKLQKSHKGKPKNDEHRAGRTGNTSEHR
jgi:uncharacterized protein (DUF362 family)/Pyruvate/2-oxoacid:ferredoxin oxidoreductase delta subunit